MWIPLKVHKSIPFLTCFCWFAEKNQFISLLNFLCQCLCPYKENMTVMPYCLTTNFICSNKELKSHTFCFYCFLLSACCCSFFVLLFDVFVLHTNALSNQSEMKWWYVIYFRCCNKPHTYTMSIHNFLWFAVRMNSVIKNYARTEIPFAQWFVDDLHFFGVFVHYFYCADVK